MILLDDRQLDWDLKLQIFTEYHEQKVYHVYGCRQEELLVAEN